MILFKNSIGRHPEQALWILRLSAQYDVESNIFL